MLSVISLTVVLAALPEPPQSARHESSLQRIDSVVLATEPGSDERSLELCGAPGTSFALLAGTIGRGPAAPVVAGVLDAGGRSEHRLPAGISLGRESGATALYVALPGRDDRRMEEIPLARTPAGAPADFIWIGRDRRGTPVPLPHPVGGRRYAIESRRDELLFFDEPELEMEGGASLRRDGAHDEFVIAGVAELLVDHTAVIVRAAGQARDGHSRLRLALGDGELRLRPDCEAGAEGRRAPLRVAPDSLEWVAGTLAELGPGWVLHAESGALTSIWSGLSIADRPRGRADRSPDLLRLERPRDRRSLHFSARGEGLRDGPTFLLEGAVDRDASEGLFSSLVISPERPDTRRVPPPVPGPLIDVLDRTAPDVSAMGRRWSVAIPPLDPSQAGQPGGSGMPAPGALRGRTELDPSLPRWYAGPGGVSGLSGGSPEQSRARGGLLSAELEALAVRAPALSEAAGAPALEWILELPGARIAAGPVVLVRPAGLGLEPREADDRRPVPVPKLPVIDRPAEERSAADDRRPVPMPKLPVIGRPAPEPEVRRVHGRPDRIAVLEPAPVHRSR